MLYRVFFCLRHSRAVFAPVCALIRHAIFYATHTPLFLRPLAFFAPACHTLLRSTLNRQAKCASHAFFFFFLFAHPRAKPLKRHTLNAPVCAFPHYQPRAKSAHPSRVFCVLRPFVRCFCAYSRTNPPRILRVSLSAMPHS